MGARCSGCALGLPCLDVENADDMVVVSANALARYRAASSELKRDERNLQRLIDLQDSFARDRQLNAEGLTRVAERIRSFYRVRGELAEYGAARAEVQRCYLSPCEHALQCAAAVRSLSAVADAGPDKAGAPTRCRRKHRRRAAKTCEPTPAPSGTQQ